MQLTSLLTLALTLTSTASAATWNRQIQVWDIGRVASMPGFPGLAQTYPGKCDGIPEGGWVCGSFGPKKVAMRAIYQCTEGKLKLRELCNSGNKNNHCVKNGRSGRGGKLFYPSQGKDKIVCLQKKHAMMD